MKQLIASLAILLLSGGLSATAESLIVTNGETLELGGSKSYDNVLISNGTIYLTNDTIITSTGDISVLSGGTVTWHYTTTNWIIATNLPYRGGSFVAKNGADAWSLSLQATSNLLCSGRIDLRGGAGQTHVGKAGKGSYGGTAYFDAAHRAEHKGGNGGDSQGGNGGQGGSLELQAGHNHINLRNAALTLSGGQGGNGGTGGTGGTGGDWSWPPPGQPQVGGQGADGGDGGASLGGDGGNGGKLVIRTKVLLTDNWSCSTSGGANGLGGQPGSEGSPGLGDNGYGFWEGSQGEEGSSYNGSLGTNGVMDVIKQAEARTQLENGQLRLGLDMTSTSATYTVECCTNLFTADWQPIGTFSGQGGATNWTSALSNSFDKAFYRIQTTY